MYNGLNLNLYPGFIHSNNSRSVSQKCGTSEGDFAAAAAAAAAARRRHGVQAEVRGDRSGGIMPASLKRIDVSLM